MNDSNIYFSVSLVAIGTVVGVVSCYTYLNFFGDGSKKRKGYKQYSRTNSFQSQLNSSAPGTSLSRTDSIRRRSRRSGVYFGNFNEDLAQQILDANIEPNNQTINTQPNPLLPTSNGDPTSSSGSFDAQPADTALNFFDNDALDLITLGDDVPQDFGDNINLDSVSSPEDVVISRVQGNEPSVGADSQLFDSTNTQMVIDALERILDISENSEAPFEDNSSTDNASHEHDSSAIDANSINLEALDHDKIFSKKKLELESTSSILELLLILADTKSKRKNIVHRGVTCDGCNLFPVTGVRYKCAQCFDFDICESCEAKNIHKGHLFLKIKIPAPSMMNDHVPIMNSFYPGNMIVSEVPSKEVSKIFLEAMKVNTKFSTAEVYALYDEYCAFADYDAKGVNGINRNVFQKSLGVYGTKNSLLSDMMFKFYDLNKDGKISFDEMVFGMGILMRGSRSEKGKFFFRVFDLNNDGFLSLSELKTILTSSFHFNKRYIQEMMSYMNDSIIVQPGDLLPDQPISSSFTISIPPESTSALDKEVGNLRRQLSDLRQSNSNRLESFNLLNQGRLDLDSIISSSSISEETNNLSSSSRNNEIFNLENTTQTTPVLPKDGLSCSEKSENLEESFQNPQFNIFSDHTNLDKKRNSFKNSKTSISENQLKYPNELSHTINSDPKLGDINLSKSGKQVYTQKSGELSQIENPRNLAMDTLSGLHSQSYSKLIEDPTSASDWPIMDLLIEDAVNQISEELFKKIKNRKSEIGLTRSEFIELVNKDPRPLQWFEIIGPVF
ncbi:EF-hand calcium-binding domain-containing protein 1 [Smittium mucronatum]|uniref:EF-hand calcium-binding domain-containing protein 1 n=1 Tax=Smittium mucronatum TaxID=133383 RepID=A0A1R0GNT5_9FUNG|nr:EF-hand calcium-binding domain-containing protein 1 [Smittium mucronatum]